MIKLIRFSCSFVAFPYICFILFLNDKTHTHTCKLICQFRCFSCHLPIFYFFNETHRQTKTSHHNQTTLESWLKESQRMRKRTYHHQMMKQHHHDARMFSERWSFHWRRDNCIIHRISPTQQRKVGEEVEETEA